MPGNRFLNEPFLFFHQLFRPIHRRERISPFFQPVEREGQAGAPNPHVPVNQPFFFHDIQISRSLFQHSGRGMNQRVSHRPCLKVFLIPVQPFPNGIHVSDGFLFQQLSDSNVCLMALQRPQTITQGKDIRLGMRRGKLLGGFRNHRHTDAQISIVRLVIFSHGFRFFRRSGFLKFSHEFVSQTYFRCRLHRNMGKDLRRKFQQRNSIAEADGNVLNSQSRFWKEEAFPLPQPGNVFLNHFPGSIIQ